MLPIRVADFEGIGVWVQDARRGPALKAWAEGVIRQFLPREVMEAASVLASPLAGVIRGGDPRGKVALAATLAAAGIPCMLEGLSMISPQWIDELDVLVLDRDGWVPTNIAGPRYGREPLARHRLRWMP